MQAIHVPNHQDHLEIAKTLLMCLCKDWGGLYPRTTLQGGIHLVASGKHSNSLCEAIERQWRESKQCAELLGGAGLDNVTRLCLRLANGGDRPNAVLRYARMDQPWPSVKMDFHDKIFVLVDARPADPNQCTKAMGDLQRLIQTPPGKAAYFHHAITRPPRRWQGTGKQIPAWTLAHTAQLPGFECRDAEGRSVTFWGWLPQRRRRFEEPGEPEPAPLLASRRVRLRQVDARDVLTGRWVQVPRGPVGQKLYTDDEYDDLIYRISHLVKAHGGDDTYVYELCSLIDIPTKPEEVQDEDFVVLHRDAQFLMGNEVAPEFRDRNDDPEHAWEPTARWVRDAVFVYRRDPKHPGRALVDEEHHFVADGFNGWDQSAERAQECGALNGFRHAGSGYPYLRDYYRDNLELMARGVAWLLRPDPPTRLPGPFSEEVHLVDTREPDASKKADRLINRGFTELAAGGGGRWRSFRCDVAERVSRLNA